MTALQTYICCREYIEQLSPHDPDAKGNETLYLFGPDSELGNAWAPLIAAYGRPPFAKGEIAYSFGVGTWPLFNLCPPHQSGTLRFLFLGTEVPDSWPN